MFSRGLQPLVWALVPALVFLAGCALFFQPTGGRPIELSFEIQEEIVNGTPFTVGSWVLPPGINPRGKFVQLSGKLVRPEDSRRPQRVKVFAETVELESGKRISQLRMAVELRPEDTFRANKKLKKRLLRGGLLTVTVEPEGAEIPAGSKLTLCLDLMEKRRDLRTIKSCAPGPAAASFSGIQDTIFTPSCAVGGCHDAATAESGLVLEAGTAYGELVNVPSEEVTSELRVRPKSPDRSYLVDKLRGTAPVGVRMPQGGPFLTDEQLSGILEWIENGAPND